jgi:hypothetical protein
MEWTTAFEASPVEEGERRQELLPAIDRGEQRRSFGLGRLFRHDAHARSDAVVSTDGCSRRDDLAPPES